MEFVEVMRQWKRMCDSMTGCVDCPFNERDEFYCTNIYCFPNGTDWSKIESIIMSWAAEHPEPVYPTWAEWLHNNGIILDARQHDETEHWILGIEVMKPIPADIAQKLGIKPKEEG